MAGAAETQPTIYIAEDNQILLQGLERALTANGYAVRTAGDGAAVVALLESGEELPALLLLDLMMPGMNGLDVLRAVRADPRWTGIPVILITAATMGELAGTEAGAGAVDLLLKPFRLQELLEMVAARIGNAGPEAQPRGGASTDD